MSPHSIQTTAVSLPTSSAERSQCGRLGKRICSTHAAGKTLEIYQCPVHQVCTENDAGLKKNGVALKVCQTCEEYRPPLKTATYVLRDCVYRGDQIEEKEADLCGMRGRKFPVFRCNHPDLSGRCVPYRICGRQAEDCCATCQKNPAVAAKLLENTDRSRED